MNKSNPMRRIRIEKVTVHFGAGSDQSKLEKGIEIFKMLFNKNPVKTHAKRRIQGWGIRPGLPIGLKLTFRGKEAQEVLKRLFLAINNRLSRSSFDREGNFGFGIKEYIDVPGSKYRPELGLLGFEVFVTLERPGYRIKRRKIEKKRRIPLRHRITVEEAMEFVKNNFGIEIVDES
ncbi:MAG: 50S ribosomal protein L5 [Candidatus Woesearchaeota archaeon]